MDLIDIWTISTAGSKILEMLPIDEGCAARAKATSKHVVFPISF